MNQPLHGPGHRYEVVLEALTTTDGRAYRKQRADEGLPLWAFAGQAPQPAFRVMLDDACSVTVAMGENGVTLREIQPLQAKRLMITAGVTAGPQAPDWLPEERTYLLFDGDRASARSVEDRYIPFDGLAETPQAGESQTTLDRLAVAVGRSVARANAVLARGTHDSGVALVTTVTVRVSVDRTAVEGGRFVLGLGPQTGGASGPFIELTLATVPPAGEGDAGPAAGMSVFGPTGIGPGGVDAAVRGTGHGAEDAG